MPACPSDKGRLVARKSGGGKSWRQGGGKLIQYAAEETKFSSSWAEFEFASLNYNEILITLGVAGLLYFDNIGSCGAAFGRTSWRTVLEARRLKKLRWKYFSVQCLAGYPLERGAVSRSPVCQLALLIREICRRRRARSIHGRILTGKPKYLVQNLPHCHPLYHIWHVDWPGVE